MVVYFLKLFSFLLFLFLVGCETEKEKQSLNLALSADIRGFDPALATDVRTGKLISLVYDNLVSFGDSVEIFPGLAKEWSVSNDGKKYSFTIRSNAFFHDGSPITSKDVVFSFERIINPKTLSPQRWIFNNIDGVNEFLSGKTSNISGLIVKNDSLLIIKLIKPFSPFIQFLAMPSASIVNHRVVNTIATSPAGSGPWKLLNWHRDGKIKFSRNKNYWGKKPKESNLTFRILSEAMTRSAEFEAGNLDYIDVPSSEINRWVSNKKSGYRVSYAEDLNVWYVGLNCSVPPFNDVKIRKAMNYSLDREKHLHLLVPGGKLASGAIPPSLMVKKASSPYQYNPEKALDLLSEAGYPEGFSTQIWVGGGSEMFHILEALQADWMAVGIVVKIIQSDWNVFKTAVRNGEPPMYYLNWVADYPDAENFLFPLFFSKESMTKRNRYSNSTLDKFINDIQVLAPGKKREKLIVMANDILLEDVPWVFLWHKGKYSITQSFVSGSFPKLIFNAEKYINWEKKSG